MNSIQAKVNELQEIIIRHTDFENLQSYKSLSKWILNERTELDTGIQSTKILHTRNMLRFYVCMSPNTHISLHWHDCPELIQVLAGIIADKYSGKVFHTNNQAVFSRGQKHEIRNPSKTKMAILIVDFYK